MSRSLLEEEIPVVELIRRTLPQMYAPRNLYKYVETPVNVYYKVQKGRDGYAILYLFEWDQQYFPPHKWDYEPVIVITDRNGNPREVYVDGIHYFVGRYNVTSNKNWWLNVNRPWRSMELKYGRPNGNYVSVFPYTKDGKIIRVRPLTNSKLMELKSRRENPLSINERILSNLFSVRGAEHWSTYRTPSIEDLARDFAKNYGLSNILGENISTNVILLFSRIGIIVKNSYMKLRRILSERSRQRRYRRIVN